MSPNIDRPVEDAFLVGDWTVLPLSGRMVNGEKSVRLEARTMRLLLYLAERAGEIVGIDELLDRVWDEVIVTPDSVYQAVTFLRRQLGDDPRQPTYIATVHRRGYRLVAKVSTGCKPAENPSPENLQTINGQAISTRKHKHRVVGWSILIAFVVAVGLAAYGYRQHLADRKLLAIPSPKSIAVLPFQDMTDSMNEEPFADGMTDELISKLSQSQELQVSSPTSSFYFKDKNVTVEQVGASLHVAYVLDGSVRKSDKLLRVSARLVRANDGFVIWSQIYDRSWSDKLMIQDDIANEVTGALKKAIK